MYSVLTVHEYKIYTYGSKCRFYTLQIDTVAGEGKNALLSVSDALANNRLATVVHFLNFKQDFVGIVCF